MKPTLIQPPSELELSESNQQAVALIAEFGAIQITTSEQYARAADLLRDAATLTQKIAKACEPTIKAAHAAHKAATAMRNDLCAPIDEAVSVLKSNMAIFQRAEREREERERQEREKALREHEERQRAARIEAERLMKEAEIALQRAETIEGGVDALVAEIAADEAVAAANAAQDAIEETAVAPFIAVQERAKAKGVASACVVKWRMVDPDAVPREYCEPSKTLIDARVKMSKMLTHISGIEVYEEEQIRVAARR